MIVSPFWFRISFRLMQELSCFCIDVYEAQAYCTTIYYMDLDGTVYRINMK